MDFSATIAKALPESLHLYLAIIVVIIVAWNRYFSHRAFLDIKRRELELIKLAAELDHADAKAKKDLEEMTRRTLKELNQSLEAQTALSKRIKKGVLETIRDAVSHLDDNKKCVRFFIWGAAGGCLTLIILCLLVVVGGSFTLREYEILSLYGICVWLLSVVFGGMGGVLFAWNSKMQAVVGGTMAAGVAILCSRSVVVGVVNVLSRGG